MAISSRPLLDYSARLASDLGWALSEGSLFFEGQGAVQRALHKIAGHLNQLGIPYAIVGGMALFAHGVRRFTEDVDILVSPEALTAIHEHLDGRGYVRPFEKSKNLRDAEFGVKIEFLVEGQFPGDGKPKPVAFPNPIGRVNEREGIKFINLPTLIEMKLASGMTSLDRLKDLTDVQELIRTFSLPADFAIQLNAYVRPKFAEMWQATRQIEKRYVYLWRKEPRTEKAKTLDAMIAALGPDGAVLDEMRGAGVRLDLDRGTGEFAVLVTSDPDVARRFSMPEESEFWGLDTGTTADPPPDRE